MSSPMVALGDADPYDRPRLYKLQAPLAKLDPCDKLAINDFAREKIDASVNELAEERELVGDLLPG